MKLLSAIVIIAFIAILGSRLTFLNRRIPLGFRSILLTGTEYIFIGAVLGIMGFNIIDQETILQLKPFLLFGLTIVGFLFGLQFEVRLMKNLPQFYFSITAIQSFITFQLVAIPLYFVFFKLTLLPHSFILMAVITLGSTAACTAQSSLAIVNQNYRFPNRKLMELMRYITSVNGLFALIFFAGALTIIPQGQFDGFHLIESLQWLFIAATTGLIAAIILIILSHRRFTQQEFIFFVIAINLFCAGLAFKIHHSPLVSGLICGVICANYCRHRLRALSLIIHAEKSIYIILLLLLGASWDFKFDDSLLIALVYFSVRLLAKFISTVIATTIHRPTFFVPKTLGFGLISEGGLSVAIIINFQLLYPSLANPLVTVLILSIILNEILSPPFILKQFDTYRHLPKAPHIKLKNLIFSKRKANTKV